MNWELFIPILIGLISFIGKSIWDIYNKNRERKIDFLEKQLSLFYYPLIIRLEKDNVTWRLILEKKKGDDSLGGKIGDKIEKDIILPNHDEIMAIIEKHTYLCQDDHIIEMLSQYIKHIAIYKAIRASGDEETFPMHYDQSLEWPHGLYPRVVEKAKVLQRQLDGLTWK